MSAPSAPYTRPRRKRLFKAALIIIGVVLLIMLGLQIWLVNNAGDVLKEMVIEKSAGKLKLELSRLRFNFFPIDYKYVRPTW